MVFNNSYQIRCFGILVLLICSFCLFGQTRTVERYNRADKKTKKPIELDSSKLYRPNWALKFVPTELIMYTPGLQIGVEKRTVQHQALALDLSQIFSYQENENDFKGYKIGLEYRFYRDWKTGIKQNSFIGLRAEWKQTSLSGMGLFWRYNNSYRQTLSYRSIANTKNVFFIYGWMRRLGKHWAIETKLGLGARNLKILHKDIPEDAVLSEFFNNIGTFENTLRNSGQYGYPNVMGSLKIVYIL